MEIKQKIWQVIKSPKTVSWLKFGVAVLGLVHAVDDLKKNYQDQS